MKALSKKRVNYRNKMIYENNTAKYYYIKIIESHATAILSPTERIC